MRRAQATVRGLSRFLKEGERSPSTGCEIAEDSESPAARRMTRRASRYFARQA